MPAPTLRFKRGASSTIPALKQGEPAFTTDTFDLYIGADSTLLNNKFFGSHRYWNKETSTTGSSVKLIEGTSYGSNYIALKSPNSLASNITLTLPDNYGPPNSLLSNDGLGNLTWVATLNLAGINTFTNTQDSYNTTTGTIVVYGGIGVGKNLNVGGSLSVSGLSTFSDGVNISGISTFNDDLNLFGLASFNNGLNVSGTSIFDDNVRVNSIGVGIGTTVFSTALHVEGDTLITGNLTVKGTTTSIDVNTVNIKDSIIDLGLVDDGNGNLIPPSSDSNIDLGVVFNYYTDAPKKSGIFWDDSSSKIGIASDLTETSSIIVANSYADLVIKSLWINDCAGESEVIKCSGSTRELANIVIDGGFY